jgi:hypothetical protein
MPMVSIEHATRYTYRTGVTLGPQRLMLRPREGRDLSLVLACPLKSGPS